MNQNLNRNIFRTGFTIIELMLAMSFVSVLLVSVTMTVIQISHIYNKGLMMKGTNQAGRSIIDELQRSINSSPSFDLSNNYRTKVLSDGSSAGRLCVGQYSYIWNDGKTLSGLATGYIYRYENPDQDTQIRLVKVLDADASYCSNPDKLVVKADSNDLLGSNQYNLVIQKFNISSSDSALDSRTGQRLYRIEFYLGTNDQNALIDSIACKPTSLLGSNSSFCSVVGFNILVRAGNVAK
ncbi:MAG: hypothetical protein WCQ49_01005 [Candidatus Saccharibacteria bacterium]